MSRAIIGTIVCFGLGVALGSLAPLVVNLGQNTILVRLIVDTWRRYLLDEGWWVCSIGSGLLLAALYLCFSMLAARRADGTISQNRDAPR